MAIISSIDALIGHTPLLRLSHIERELGFDGMLLGKLESFNASGSTKDRAALQMIISAEEEGLLAPGATIIEPTSGNTGIGLAAIAASRGYRMILVMPESMSLERRKLCRAYGAEVVFSPASLGMAGSVAKAEELHASIAGSWIPGQFDNPANPDAHYKTTGPEIFADCEGNLEYFIVGIGTGGTVSGVGRYLKERIPSLRVIGVEPASSPLLTEGKAGPHRIQGIGANFVPKNLDRSVLDEVMDIADEEAFRYGKMMGRLEGTLVGISGGAALAAAARLIQRGETKGKRIVVFFPDGGDRYLSTALYEE